MRLTAKGLASGNEDSAKMRTMVRMDRIHAKRD